MKIISSVTGLFTLFLFLFLNILPESALAIPKAPEPDRAGKARIVENYGKLPLSFEKNQGQTDEKVGFLSRGGGYTLFLTPDEAVLVLSSPSKDEGLGERREDASQVSRPEKQKEAKGAVIRMKFSGANTAPVISGQERLQGTSNYFIGNDPSKWRTRISKYAKVRYREVYPGIDLVFYGNQKRLEYDFVVSPGSDPSKIRLEFQGVEEVSLDGNGNLVLRLKDGEVIQQAPVIYQEVDGRRVDVAGGYWIDRKGRVGCQVASWDRRRPLVIDPVLVYSTYLGGTDTDDGLSIAVDTSGNAYITGYTFSTDFPTASPIQGTQAGHYDAFVTKIDTSGSNLVYSTFLGGSSEDRGRGIAVDSSGCAYITGFTVCSDFPTTAGAYDTTLNGRDAFITKINTSGSSLVYSTYLGGNDSDYGYAIALDSSENAYITGVTWSPDFPTASPIQGTFAGGNYDAFVTKIDASGSSLVYSTYLGGNHIDVGAGIAVDPNGGAYITGLTLSSDFPTASPIFGTMMGDRDAFVTKIDASGSFFSYSTYLGGNDEDHGNGIAVDSSGSAYVTGITNSTDFPTVLAFQGSYVGGHYDAFVTKMDASGSSLVYSTYLGGGGDDRGYGIAVNAGGNAYVTGWTDSSNFPTVKPVQATFAGENDAFVTKIDSSGSSLDYSTFLGGNDSDYGWGIAVDISGNAYVTGYTTSSDFPTVNALYPNLRGSDDAFIAKISDNTAPGHLYHFLFPLSGTLENRTINLAFGADWPWGECGGLVKKHVGVDISAVKGESVYAANPGIVRAIVDGGTQWAKAVTIEHITSDPVFTTVYWHIDPAVTLGQTVANGQIIGNIADLGANTHLHFGVRMSAYSNISNRGALPQTDCGGDPAFPEHFVDPLGLDYAYVWTLPGHQLEYGDLPAQTPTAKNLVFITHGWNSDKYVWATDMANSINGTIKDRINLDEWDVWTYDWSFDARKETDYITTPVGIKIHVPFQAFVNAISHGKYVGQKLAGLNYEHIHFIAHSAGSALIDTAASWIKAIDKDSPPTIHCTFLDAYDPRGDLSPYGANALWAEQYVDTRPFLPPLVEEFDTTDTYLKNCFNFDVTELDEEGMDADYLSRHAWPRVFYQETIDDDSFSCGFSLSLESGISVSDFMLNKQVYPLGGNCICPICDISIPDISTHYIWEYNNPFDFYAAQDKNEIIKSNTGTVTIDPSIPSQVTLTQGSPVWMSMQFEVIEPINILSLDYEFFSSSDGLLSVFFDNEVVSKIDERVAFEGTNEASSIWLGEVEPGTHVLSFRLDSFTGGQSVVEISNVRTGIMKAIPTEDATIQTLQDLLSIINNLDNGVFKNKNTVKTLTNKINAILKQVDGGLYQGALGKMAGDILPKTNGCAEGGVPDKNDWIVDCEAQNQVYPLVIKVIELLGSLS